jgi:dynein heavy chain
LHVGCANICSNHHLKCTGNANYLVSLLVIPCLQVLIRPEILPQGDLADPETWQPPLLELAPGFKAPMPKDYDVLRDYIETALPAESPVVYGMHSNAELSLLTSLGETLFSTITDVSGSGSGASGGGGGGEAMVRAALKEYMERLPELFNLVDIEARVKEKSPYVVVALQEVSPGWMIPFFHADEGASIQVQSSPTFHHCSTPYAS